MIDFKQRSPLKELLDNDTIPFEDIKQNMMELNTINTLLGGHSITVKGVNACGNSTASTLAIIVSGCVRTTAGISTSTNMNVYPNPSSGKITLEVSTDQEKLFTVTVNDMMGRQIINLNPKLNLGKNNLDIDMSAYAKGVYTLHVIDGQSENNLRVVLQ